jgi:hypothetical protein
MATSFYHPFGAKRGAWDLIRFAAEFYRRDAWIVAGCAARR